MAAPAGNIQSQHNAPSLPPSDHAISRYVAAAALNAFGDQPPAKACSTAADSHDVVNISFKRYGQPNFLRHSTSLPPRVSSR